MESTSPSQYGWRTWGDLQGNCPDIRNSKVDLVRELEGWGLKVVVCDPWADAAEVAHEYGLTLQDGTPPQVDALVVAVGHNQYRHLSPAELKAFCRGATPVLADLKSLYDRHAVAQAGFTVFRL